MFLGRSVTQHKQISDDTARKLDAEVREIIDRNQRAQHIAGEHQHTARDGRRAGRNRDTRSRCDRCADGKAVRSAGYQWKTGDHHKTGRAQENATEKALPAAALAWGFRWFEFAKLAAAKSRADQVYTANAHRKELFPSSHAPGLTRCLMVCGGTH